MKWISYESIDDTRRVGKGAPTTMREKGKSSGARLLSFTRDERAKTVPLTVYTLDCTTVHGVEWRCKNDRECER